MSLTNPNTPVSQQDLQDFYHKILPYMGGSSTGSGSTGSLFRFTYILGTDLQGKSVTLTNGDGKTSTGIFDENGVCEIVTPYIGNITITTSAVPSLSLSVSVQYYTLFAFDFSNNTGLTQSQAYRLANDAVRQGFLAYTGVIWTYFDGGGSVFRYSTAPSDNNLDANYMTLDNSATSVFDGKISVRHNANTSKILTFNHSGIIVLSKAGGVSVRLNEMVANAFETKAVSIGDTLTLPYDLSSGANFVSFYETT